jgi:hypothetical protein
MFTFAAIETLFTLICIYGAISAWKRGSRRMAGLMLIPLALVGGLAFLSIRTLVTSDDPLLWIRQPMPCWPLGC